MTAPILDTRLQALEELRWHVGNIEEGVIVTVLPDDGRKYVSLNLKS